MKLAVEGGEIRETRSREARGSNNPELGVRDWSKHAILNVARISSKNGTTKTWNRESEICTVTTDKALKSVSLPGDDSSLNSIFIVTTSVILQSEHLLTGPLTLRLPLLIPSREHPTPQNTTSKHPSSAHSSLQQSFSLLRVVLDYQAYALVDPTCERRSNTSPRDGSIPNR